MSDDEIPSDSYRGQPPHEPGDDAGTSKLAALKIAPKAGSLRYRVLRYIVARGEHGATDDEIEMASGVKHQTISARRRELVLGGFAVRPGPRRLTRSDTLAAVTYASDKGRTTINGDDTDDDGQFALPGVGRHIVDENRRG